MYFGMIPLLKDVYDIRLTLLSVFSLSALSILIWAKEEVNWIDVQVETSYEWRSLGVGIRTGVV